MIFNQRVNWTENMRIVAWVAQLSGHEKLQAYHRMQCIKESSTLRVSPKKGKPAPVVIHREGKQDKEIMKKLTNKGYFDEQRFCWILGASIGIKNGEPSTEAKRATGKRETFQNINSLDPEEVFAAIMLGKYPELSPEERVQKLIDHAEWGIREIERMDNDGTLNFEILGK